MAESDPIPTRPALEWLPYHRAIIDFLTRTDPKVWNWFSKSTADPKAGDEVRFELLKSTYRIEREAQPELYQVVSEVAQLLDVAAPVTIYQAQNPSGLNASLAFVPEAIHLVLHGPIAEKLTLAEIKALVGHELAHYVLWQDHHGEMYVAAEMVRALTNDPKAHPAHLASLRLMRLYNEIFCDRAALLAAGSLNTVISMQIKIETGLQNVDPGSYLRQAEEVFEHTSASATGPTHPEGYIRARALKLWSDGCPEVDKIVEQMIEGTPGLDDLDLLAQERVARVTRRMMDVLLSRKWFQTDLVLAQARLYFDDYCPPEELITDDGLAEQVGSASASIRDYYCFVLLDFCSADRDLEEAPLAAALKIAESIGIKARFVELIRKELRLRKQQLETIDEQKETILVAADRMVAASQ